MTPTLQTSTDGEPLARRRYSGWGCASTPHGCGTALESHQLPLHRAYEVDTTTAGGVLTIAEQIGGDGAAESALLSL
jgi:hypothetical protein